MTHRTNKRILAIAVLVLITIPLMQVCTFGAKKASKTALKSRLGNVRQQIRQVRYKIKLKEGEQRTVTGQLSVIERDLGEAQDHLNTNKMQLLDATSDLEATTKRLGLAKRQLSRRQKLLARRVVDIYEGQDLNYVDVVLGSTDMWTFLSRAYYLQQILHSDSALITEIKNLKESIERDKARQTQRVSQISSLQVKLEHERNQVASLADAKRNELDDVEHDKAKMQQVLDELEQKSQEIENAIRAYQSTPVGKKMFAKSFHGGLMFPVSGRVSSSFGYRVHPITGVYKLHTGVDISVPSGTPVHAAADGRVILAGWMGAYGYAVVIDHGGGVSTLYGHNSNLLVRVGETVHQGEVIAKSGSTGYSTGPHCHFEKRVNGTPVNPGRP